MKESTVAYWKNWLKKSLIVSAVICVCCLISGGFTISGLFGSVFGGFAIYAAWRAFKWLAKWTLIGYAINSGSSSGGYSGSSTVTYTGSSSTGSYSGSTGSGSQVDYAAQKQREYEEACRQRDAQEAEWHRLQAQNATNMYDQEYHNNMANYYGG